MCGERHHLRRIHHVVDADILVGLMREIEDPRPIGDAVVQMADAGDVLLVVGAGRDDVLGVLAEDRAGRLGDAQPDRRVTVGHGRQGLEEIADGVAEVGPGRRQPVEEAVSFGPFSFHLGRGELKCGEDIIRLTERERELLRIFATQPGETVSRLDLAASANGSERAVDVQINRLRRKIETDPGNPIHLQTVRGIGYRLQID